MLISGLKIDVTDKAFDQLGWTRDFVIKWWVSRQPLGAYETKCIETVFCVNIFIYIGLILHQLNRGMLSRFWNSSFKKTMISLHPQTQKTKWRHIWSRNKTIIFTVYRSGPSDGVGVCCHTAAHPDRRPAYKRMFILKAPTPFVSVFHFCCRHRFFKFFIMINIIETNSYGFHNLWKLFCFVLF